MLNCWVSDKEQRLRGWPEDAPDRLARSYAAVFGRYPRAETVWIGKEAEVIRNSLNSNFLIAKVSQPFQDYQASLPRLEVNSVAIMSHHRKGQRKPKCVWSDKLQSKPVCPQVKDHRLFYWAPSVGVALFILWHVPSFSSYPQFTCIPIATESFCFWLYYMPFLEILLWKRALPLWEAGRDFSVHLIRHW